MARVTDRPVPPMKLSIVQVADRGVPNVERLHMRALLDIDLCFFIILDVNVIVPKTRVSSKPKNAYWFSTHPVKAGDNVVLYTGTGVDMVRPNGSGGTDHFFYWGCPQTLWALPTGAAVVCEISEWTTAVG